MIKSKYCWKSEARNERSLIDTASAALLHPVFKELPNAAHSDQLALVDHLLMLLSNSSSSNLQTCRTTSHYTNAKYSSKQKFETSMVTFSPCSTDSRKNLSLLLSFQFFIRQYRMAKTHPINPWGTRLIFMPNGYCKQMLRTDRSQWWKGWTGRVHDTFKYFY